jgi:thiol-disulfide isomerase/thioredoxin
MKHLRVSTWTSPVVLLIWLASCFIPSSSFGAEKATASKPGAVKVYLFWGEGCPHCAKEKDVLAALKQKYPQIEVLAFEVWRDKENAEFFNRVMNAAGAKTVGVPATVVGDRLFFGFAARTAAAIEDAIAACVNQGCPDTETVIAGLSEKTVQGGEKSIAVPLLGEVEPATMSLPLFTIIIGGLDSFNPCAFFVLLFLLSLLIHARSRRRMLLIGGIFVLFSGVVYFLFMAAWLNIFLIIGQLVVITVTAGVIALIVAGINIKDFFFFKKGVSLMIPEKAKPRLFERMRGLLKSPTLPAIIAGTVVLAVTANAYELLCTAGFPMVYTRVLTLHELTAAQYYLYLALYNVVYVIPMAVIVAVVTITLGARKLTEWRGRVLKLMSGLMMLLLGAVLLIDPALLNNVLAAVLILAAALIISGLTVLITKRVNPEIARE